ncbi:helix-hairpin-helix domain-containing protein [Olivibacter sitiensis]|uniref:helix-hairpin-helix domain-containing protein n=1 Tax=Olivibacter sitiensis TaxID=376470 RepID=UPI0003FA4075|nr:helix-hairpin-helix domain-containing protein [Olivibacter sitiensis]
MHWLQKYFGFNKRERNGIVILLCIIAAILFIPFLHGLYVGNNQIVPFNVEIVPLPQQYDAVSGTDQGKGEKVQQTEVVYFPFNPNKLSLEQGKRLGLHEGQIRNIQNYVAKGGKFRKAIDLKRIYTISDQDYARLEPYVRIQEDVDKHKESRKQATFEQRKVTDDTGNSAYNKPADAIKSIDINKADSVQWTGLKGIGPVFASRIVRYRELLGGYHSVEQLLEVYGMDSLRLMPLLPSLHVDKAVISKIEINKADYAILRAHPYISNKQAQLIVQYRKQHGSYKSIADLLKIAVFDEDFLRKIAPYIHINED